MYYKEDLKLRLHTKVVLLTTIALILIGAFGLLFLERGKLAIIDAFFSQ